MKASSRSNRQPSAKGILTLLLALVLGAGLLLPAAADTWNPFYDISPSDWYYDDVLSAVESGLVNGKTETLFCPDEYLTYAEAVKLAACLNQLWWDGAVTLENGWPWYQPYADYCLDTGIISDVYDWGAFATRGRFLALFAGALPASALSGINYIPDE